MLRAQTLRSQGGARGGRWGQIAGLETAGETCGPLAVNGIVSRLSEQVTHSHGMRSAQSPRPGLLRGGRGPSGPLGRTWELDGPDGHLDVEDGAASPKAVLPATGSSVKALVLRQD